MWKDASLMLISDRHIQTVDAEMPFPTFQIRKNKKSDNDNVVVLLGGSGVTAGLSVDNTELWNRYDITRKAGHAHIASLS